MYHPKIAANPSWGFAWILPIPCQSKRWVVLLALKFSLRKISKKVAASWPLVPSSELLHVGCWCLLGADHSKQSSGRWEVDDEAEVVQCVMLCLKGMCKVQKYSDSWVSVPVIAQLHLPAPHQKTLQCSKVGQWCFQFIFVTAQWGQSVRGHFGFWIYQKVDMTWYQSDHVWICLTHLHTISSPVLSQKSSNI